MDRFKQKEEVIISYNRLAMEQLQQENYDNSLNYLKQALIGIKGITDEYKKNKLMAVTYNNLGIFFKRMTNFQEALKYLYKSIELENKLPNEISTISGSHLNICSILSQQGDHSRAIRHGLRAVFLLKAAYSMQPKLVPTLIIAYYNVANEYFQLSQPGDAEDCFKIGYKISLEELGPQHNLTITMRNSLGNFSRKLSPNLDNPRRVIGKKSLSPKARVPIISAKSRSTSQEHNNLFAGSAKSNERSRARNFEYENQSLRNPQNIGRPAEYSKIGVVKKPFKNKAMSDEERSVVTEKSFNSLGASSRRIDLNRHKATERMAAVIIQSWWRGYKARKLYQELKLKNRLRLAETKARKAVEEYEKLKQQAAKINKKFK